MKETIIVLDYLPNGHPLDPRPLHLREPLIQGIVKETLVLLEVVPAQGTIPKVQTEIDLQDEKQIKRVKGRISYQSLTHGAKVELEYALTKLVDEQEKLFVEFFNKATPVTTRLHSLELIPGIGKKHMWDIINERKKSPFESFENLKKRIRLLPDPKKGIVQRLSSELQELDRYYLFVTPPKRAFKRW